MKCDIKAYSKLREISHYDMWYKDVLATMRAQGIEVVLDPNFKPDPASIEMMMDWSGVQAFSYAMLRYTVKPVELKQYVDAYSETSDAQRVFILMTDHVRNSTYAIIATRDMMRQIVAIRLNLKTWNKSTYEFVVNLNQMFTLYNNQQNNVHLHINEHMRRTYMQNALSTVHSFQAVTERENDRIIMGGPPFTYDEYMTAVKAVATKVDTTRNSKSSRDVNMLMYEVTEEDLEVPTAEREYAINEVKRKFRSQNDYASQMNKETWNKLDKDAQGKWDQFSKEQKAIILNYAMDRAERRTSTNVHELEDTKEISANVHDTSDQEQVEETSEEEPARESSSINVNNVLTGARSEAHPGDPRRMMGSSKPTLPSQEENLQAMFHRLNKSYDSSGSSSSEEDEGGSQDFRQGGW